MRTQSAVIAAVALVCTGLVTGASHRPTRGTALTTHLQSERTRLQAHFDSVDLELRSRTQVSLSPSQRTARADLIEWLQEYRVAGRFPLNLQYVDRVTPIFRDDRGVLCAMAYLVERSGRHDLVDRIAHSRNTARIAELGGNADLIGWLDSVGLDPAEAARIQPEYPPPPGTVYARDAVGSGFAILSVLVGGTAIATTTMNLTRPTKSSGIAGLLAGTSAMLLGLNRLDGSRATKRVAALDLVAGGVSFLFGLKELVGHQGDQPATNQRGGRKLSRFDVAVQPTLITTTDRPVLGLMLHARF